MSEKGCDNCRYGSYEGYAIPCHSCDVAREYKCWKPDYTALEAILADKDVRIEELEAAGEKVCDLVLLNSSTICPSAGPWLTVSKEKFIETIESLREVLKQQPLA